MKLPSLEISLLWKPSCRWVSRKQERKSSVCFSHLSLFTDRFHSSKFAEVSMSRDLGMINVFWCMMLVFGSIACSAAISAMARVIWSLIDHGQPFYDALNGAFQRVTQLSQQTENLESDLKIDQVVSLPNVDCMAMSMLNWYLLLVEPLVNWKLQL